MPLCKISEITLFCFSTRAKSHSKFSKCVIMHQQRNNNNLAIVFLLKVALSRYVKKSATLWKKHLILGLKFLPSTCFILCNHRSYIKDLVETTHLFLKMLEHFSKRTGHLVVQKKKKTTGRKKKTRNQGKIRVVMYFSHFY